MLDILPKMPYIIGISPCCGVKAHRLAHYPVASAAGVFLSMRFQVIHIQVNKVFMPFYFQNNPAASKSITVSIPLDNISIRKEKKGVSHFFPAILYAKWEWSVDFAS